MNFIGLGLWEDEELRIHECLKVAIKELIQKGVVKAEDNERKVCALLRPVIVKYSKQLELDWTFHSEANIFKKLTDPEPYARTDFQFSRRDQDWTQFDYHVECKLVRVKRKGSTHDYCSYYVEQGILDRYYYLKYCSDLVSGTMIGFLQEGKPNDLLSAINDEVQKAGLQTIAPPKNWIKKDISLLEHSFVRHNKLSFHLWHIWADFR